MTLSDYAAALKKGWLIILVIVTLALACATALVVRKPDVYRSGTELFVAPKITGGNPDLLAQRNAVATSRVKSYVNVVMGDVVGQRVDEAVGGMGDAGVSVIVPFDTVVLSLTVTSGDPQHAADVARAYAEVVPSVVEELETSGDSPPLVHVTTINEADVPSAPDPVSVVPVLGAAGILGLGLGLTIVIVRQVLRRERAEAEAAAAMESANT